jgi:uncharacterized Zn finger protein
MTNYQVETREWWVQRWLELLDSYRFKKRLERARLYAREGNVLSIDFQGEEVVAKVQGSETEPYQVSLSLVPFSEEDWDYIIQSLSEKAIFSAELLAGKMPTQIEEAFTANGLSLFPFSLQDIRSRCSCPDQANPCKHIGAVYYQLGDRFSEDPFVLFQLRGKTKTDILNSLRKLRSQQAKPEKMESSLKVSLKNVKKEIIALNCDRFWYYNEPHESSLVVITPDESRKTSKEILGNIPLNYGDSQIIKQYLDTVYQTVSHTAMITALNRDDPE